MRACVHTSLLDAMLAATNLLFPDACSKRRICLDTQSADVSRPAMHPEGQNRMRADATMRAMLYMTNQETLINLYSLPYIPYCCALFICFYGHLSDSGIHTALTPFCTYLCITSLIAFNTGEAIRPYGLLVLVHQRTGQRSTRSWRREVDD
jgi:hypothetical protein